MTIREIHLGGNIAAAGIGEGLQPYLGDVERLDAIQQSTEVLFLLDRIGVVDRVEVYLDRPDVTLQKRMLDGPCQTRGGRVGHENHAGNGLEATIAKRLIGKAERNAEREGDGHAERSGDGI